MSYKFTTQEIQKLQSARALCPTGNSAPSSTGNWVPLYKELSKILAERSNDTFITGSDLQDIKNVKLWLDVAIEANGGTGMHSTFIRTYTNRQGKLRIGREFTSDEMQLASNGVALNLWRNISDPQNTTSWSVPSISILAEYDASSIGLNLFSGKLNSNDTAISANSAWSGTLGFNLLGGTPPYEAWRLLTDGNIFENINSKLDSLDDLKNVLYAFDAYKTAWNAAFIDGGVTFIKSMAESLVAVASEGKNYDASTVDSLVDSLISQWNINTSSNNWDGQVVSVAERSPNIAPIFRTIGSIGTSRFLDMLRGAILAQGQTGTTTAAIFDSNAQNTFSLSPEELHATKIKLLPSNPQELAKRAKLEDDVRAALAGLSIIAISTPTSTRQRISLYDSLTGTGEISDKWLQDRSEMTSRVALSDWTSNTIYTTESRESIIYIDLNCNAQVLLGATILNQKVQVVFGSDRDDTVFGYGLGDRIYGGFGNDILNGLGGNDYLEGNSGDDIINGDAGKDIILGGEGVDIIYGGVDNDQILGDSGNDILYGETGQDTIQGGSGNDVLNGGADNDQLYGGANDDWLAGNAGNDQLNGEDGNDIYSFEAGWGNDIIDDSDGKGSITISGLGAISGGGAKKIDANQWLSADKNITYSLITASASSNDLLIRFADRTDTITIRNWASGNLGITLDQAAPVTPATTNTYTGTTGPDRLFGSTGSDLLVASDGNDLLVGGEGNDMMDGGSGDDLILGGLGADSIQGSGGADWIYGSGWGSVGPAPQDPAPVPAGATVITRGTGWAIYIDPITGRDMLSGVNATPLASDAANLIDGGAGDDHIDSGTGHDITHGGDGNDLVYGLSGNDLIFGDAGNDTIFGDGTTRTGTLESVSGIQHGNDILIGGAGTDNLFGDGGDDEVYGGDDNDYLYGDQSTLNRGMLPEQYDGNDYLAGGAGSDWMEGGQRDDMLYGGKDDDIMFGDGAEVNAPSTFEGKDFLSGEDGYDQITGGGNDDVIFGGNGGDQLWGDGSGSNATNQGKDEIHGDLGNDFIFGGGSDDQLFGGDDNDFIRGDDNVSVIVASAHGDDQIYGGFGQDTLLGDGGNDVIYGGDSDDWLAGEDQLTQDDFTELNGNDTIYGEAGNDVLIGGAGNDILDGGAGNDLLLGGSGNDTLIASTGSDDLIGGDGDDRFVLTFSTDGTPGARIQDTGTAGTDTLVISGVAPVISNFTRYGDLLLVHSTDGIVFGGIQGFFAGDVIERIEFDNGVVKTVSDIKNILMSGDAQNNTINGFTTDDVINAGGGNDHVFGDAGNDTIDGGSGDDIINAGTGNNTIIFSRGSGHDRTENIKRNLDSTDTIQMETGLIAADIKITRQEDDIQLSIASTGDSILLSGWITDIGQQAWGAQKISFSNGTIWDVNTIGKGFTQGTSGADTITGFTGNDLIDGGAGNDLINGGRGKNIFVFGRGDGSDTVDQGTNFGDQVLRFKSGIATSDVAYVRQNHDLIALILGTSDKICFKNIFNPDSSSMARLQRIEYSDGTVIDSNQWDLNAPVTLSSVSLLATAGDDFLYGSTLDDEIHTNSGNDYIFGGQGNEIIYGELGNDTIYGGEGHDKISGGLGNDNLSGEAGNDTVDGGPGNDIIYGGTGNDTFLFGRGDGMDIIYPLFQQPSGASNTLKLKSGIFPGDISINSELNSGTGGAILKIIGTSDELYLGGLSAALAGATSPVIQQITFDSGIIWDLATLATQIDNTKISAGTSGNDVLRGDAKNNTLEGNFGNDQLYGGQGNDLLNGGEGQDQLNGDDGNDVLNGNAGDDFLYGWNDNDQLNGDDGQDSLFGGAGADQLRGGAGNDELNGDDGNDLLNGDFGDDRLYGWNDNDQLNGDDGQDSLFGGAGTDQLHGGTGNDELNGDDGDDLLNGDFGDDRLYGWNDNDQLNGDDGQDSLVGGAGADQLHGGAGNDKLDGEDGNDLLMGDAGDDELYGRNDSDTLQGGDGNDQLSGWSGDDQLDGGSGNDSLFGDDGVDTLNGGTGNDVLQGGLNADTYVFDANFGFDGVLDYDYVAGSQDTARFTAANADQLWFTRTGNSLQVNIIGTADTVTINDWYVNNVYHIEQFKTADGRTLLDTQVDALVSAMAGFAPPGAGQTTLPTTYQTALAPVISANWK